MELEGAGRERERERDDLMNVRSLWLSLFVCDVRDCHIIVYHLNPCVNHNVHHSTGRNEEMFSSSWDKTELGILGAPRPSDLC